jgi:hypothetical protein
MGASVKSLISVGRSLCCLGILGAIPDICPPADLAGQ